MNEQCQRREGRSDARVYSKSTPDALCLELHCEWPTPGGGGYTNRKQKFRALDGSSCGTSGKRCREGSCV
ncbi:unnamed protein product [Allacma fusca]|uniref:ADAMTS cysteine-rich domain-containing protein n=1 Tax=Allacma fusca TaxID=39272 RepID=A0A8J2KRQ2_9HEXA|nr:unnamed protein product [Allacma fusca]